MTQVLQHAAGLVVAAALLRRRDWVEGAAAGVGRWLCGVAMRPNIAWLMSAKPGGCVLGGLLIWVGHPHIVEHAPRTPA